MLNLVESEKFHGAQHTAHPPDDGIQLADTAVCYYSVEMLARRAGESKCTHSQLFHYFLISKILSHFSRIEYLCADSY